MKYLLLILIVCSTVIGQPAATNDETRLLGSPSDKAKVVQVMPKGFPVEIFLQRGEWYLVQTPEYAGWVQTNMVTIGAAAMMMTSRPPATPDPEPRYTQPSRSYIRGPRGGCYYINSNGNRTYVSRSLCG